mmetsp:Transcript_12384/g.24060  ORF Transcript_12384/g.24060 Transcript_12384/m.24060 type:complete len:452 (-) Transcript_12384:63-1418(-)
MHRMARGAVLQPTYEELPAERPCKGGEETSLVPPPSPVSRRPPSSAPSGIPHLRSPQAVVGASTIANCGKSGENQDTCISSTSLDGTRNLLAVFDGHGQHGRTVSEFTRIHVAKFLFAHEELHTNPAVALEAAFLETQHQLERQLGFESAQSGTTAVAVYRHRDRLFIANAGDSRAVLGCSDSGPRTDGRRLLSGALRAVDLSSDQKPSREDERRRILAEGGAVHQSTVCVRPAPGAQPRLLRVGPDRVWDRSGTCGLCVTRSLGDVGMRPFVVAQPEITERRLGPGDRTLVLGSDGVWDRLTSQEAVEIAVRHKEPTTAAREITGVARQRWMAETQGQLSDDITAVVCHLDCCEASPPPTRASSTPSSRRPSQGGNREPLPMLPPRRGGNNNAAVVAAAVSAGADIPSRLGHSQRPPAMDTFRHGSLVLGATTTGSPLPPGRQTGRRRRS